MKKIFTISILSIFIFASAFAGDDGELNLSKKLKPVKDCFEPINRITFAVNMGLDKVIFKPVAKGYRVLPSPVRAGVSNALDNLSSLVTIPNNVLQGELKKAGINTGRFVVNTTIGVFGIFDVASRISLFSDDTEFDETFAYWGFPVGPYLELPFVGPSSVRGSMSMFVDYTLNPMSLLSGPAEGASLITFSALDILNKRHEFGTMVDTILYNSLDSYYSARSTYLQTRINEPPEPMEDNLDLFDPYEDF